MIGLLIGNLRAASGLTGFPGRQGDLRRRQLSQGGAVAWSVAADAQHADRVPRGQLGARLLIATAAARDPRSSPNSIAARVAVIGQDASLLAKDIARLASGRTGIVRLGFGPAVGRILLGDTITRITTQYPEIVSRARIRQHESSWPSNWLNRDLDIVVSHVLENAASRGPRRARDRSRQHHRRTPETPHVPRSRADSQRRGLEDSDGDPRARTTLQGDGPQEIPASTSIACRGRVICSDFELLIQLVASRPWYFTAGPTFAFAPRAGGRQAAASEQPRAVRSSRCHPHQPRGPYAASDRSSSSDRPRGVLRWRSGSRRPRPEGPRGATTSAPRVHRHFGLAVLAAAGRPMRPVPPRKAARENMSRPVHHSSSPLAERFWKSLWTPQPGRRHPAAPPHVGDDHDAPTRLCRPRSARRYGAPA